MPRKTRADTAPRKAPSAPPVEPSGDVAALAPGEILATQDVIQSLIEESAYARIRHRALLDVLTSGFTPQKYRARFIESCRRDLSALVHRSVDHAGRLSFALRRVDERERIVLCFYFWLGDQREGERE